MKPVNEKITDEFLKSVLKQELIKEPAEDLSDRVMSKITGRLPARIYKPIMPKWTLVLFIAANIALIVLAIYLPGEGNSYLPNLLGEYSLKTESLQQLFPSGTGMWIMLAMGVTYLFLILDRYFKRLFQ